MPPVTPRRIRLPCIEGLVHAVGFDYPAPPIDRQKSPGAQAGRPGGAGSEGYRPDAPAQNGPAQMGQPKMGQPKWARTFADIRPFLAPSEAPRGRRTLIAFPP